MGVGRWPRIITRPNYLISLVVTLFRRAGALPPFPGGSGEGRRALTVAGPSGTEVRVKPPHLSVFHPDDLTIGVARV